MRRNLKRAATACVLLIALLPARLAHAGACVAIAPGADVLDARGRTRLKEQLAASLAQHEIAECGAGEEALADVAFASAERGVSIAIRDVVTRKEVTRTVRVASIPPDGRPLALALAADELLRATWAEILLSRAPAPPAEPPPAVRALVVASLPPATAVPAPIPTPPSPTSAAAPRSTGATTPESALFVGASLAGERATGGLALGGVDVRAGGWLGSRASLAVRLGARAALSTRATDGQATATALLAGAGGALALIPRGGRVLLEVPIRVDVERVAFAAHPVAGAHGENGSAVGVTASTGIAAGFRLARGWTLDLEVTAGAVVRPIDANDGPATFTALSGAVIGAALGVRAEL